MAISKLLATLTVPAALALGACGVDVADEAYDSTSSATDDEELMEWSFDVVWDITSPTERQMLCDAGETYGWTWAGEQISIGAEGAVSPSRAAQLLREHCA